MKSVLNIHWKDWCWTWNSNTLVTWCKELTHWKRPWCWEWLRAGGEGGNRGWDGWMASPTQLTWVWASSESLWWTGKPGVLQSVGSQRVGHDWATELNWQAPNLTSLIRAPTFSHSKSASLQVRSLPLTVVPSLSWISCQKLGGLSTFPHPLSPHTIQHCALSVLPQLPLLLSTPTTTVLVLPTGCFLAASCLPHLRMSCLPRVLPAATPECWPLPG